MASTPTAPIQERTPKEARQVLAWHEERNEYFVAGLGDVATQLESTPEQVLEGIHSGDAIKGCFVDWAAPTQQQLNISQNHSL
jgi:hypothetical protein